MSTWASLPNNFRHETHSLLERILWMTGSQQQFKVFYLSLNRRLLFVGFFSHSQTQTKQKKHGKVELTLVWIKEKVRITT